MRLALGSDERNALTDTVVQELRERGHEVQLVGAVADADPDVDWPLSSSRVARAVAEGRVDQGIVCCWTGTGASIAANKVRGVRAALCHDAETAKGARRWNDANVLALSLRATAPGVAKEILDAWFGTPADSDAWNQAQIARLRALEGDGR